QSLVTKKTYTIGVVVPNIIGTLMSDLILGIEKYVNKEGYSLMLCISYEDPEKQLKEVKLLEQKHVDGIILFFIGKESEADAIWELKRRNYPLVLIDRYIPSIDTDYVVSDNFKGGYIAAEYLINKGHKKIGLLMEPEKVTSTRERREGFKEALHNHGIILRDDYIKQSQIRREKNGYTCLNDFMDMNEPPTAILIISEESTIGALEAVKDRGLTVPNHISIIGYDDSEHIFQLLEPPVTAVKQQVFEMGRKAGEILLKRIHGDKSPPYKVFLTPKLIERDSVSEMHVKTAKKRGRR
ncbi:MAG: substrate-binding domain-containing protein, partial [Spirochaetota bacterium]